jgi:hypothetical protein
MLVAVPEAPSAGSLTGEKQLKGNMAPTVTQPRTRIAANSLGET